MLELEGSGARLVLQSENLSCKIFIGTLFCTMDLLFLFTYATCKSQIEYTSNPKP